MGKQGYVDRERVNSAKRLQSQRNTVQIRFVSWSFFGEMELSQAGKKRKSQKVDKSGKEAKWKRELPRQIGLHHGEKWRKNINILMGSINVERDLSCGYFPKRNIYPICKGIDISWIGSFRPIQVE
ncbi:hypothetical protein KY284_034292 [Solanum tuberosum]|nr:hypothetical protein KY284_034292 [Solanum tuberosum]